MSKKQPLKAKSTSNFDVDPRDIFPKQYIITVDRSLEDSDKVTVHREAINLSGFELYGLLMVTLRAVEEQVMFPTSQRSDGITLTKAANEEPPNA